MVQTRMNIKTHIVMYAALILLFLVMISFWMVSGLFARYTAGESGSDQARVATYIFDETTIPKITDYVLFTNLKPGDTSSFVFTVTNHSESKVSEVALAYDFRVETTNNIPLTYSVVGSPTDKGKLVERKLAEDIWEGGIMNANEKTAHTYTVTITWSGSSNDYMYSEEIDMLKLILSSEQID